MNLTLLCTDKNYQNDRVSKSTGVLAEAATILWASISFPEAEKSDDISGVKQSAWIRDTNRWNGGCSR